MLYYIHFITGTEWLLATSANSFHNWDSLPGLVDCKAQDLNCYSFGTNTSSYLVIFRHPSGFPSSPLSVPMRWGCSISVSSVVGQDKNQYILKGLVWYPGFYNMEGVCIVPPIQRAEIHVWNAGTDLTPHQWHFFTGARGRLKVCFPRRRCKGLRLTCRRWTEPHKRKGSGGCAPASTARNPIFLLFV